MKQLISIEEQNSKIDELFKEQLGIDLVDNSDKHVIRLFAFWYAEKVIDKCADEARLKVETQHASPYVIDVEIETSVTNTWNDVAEEVTISKESILNVKNML